GVKRNAFGGTPLRFDNRGRAASCVFQQLEGNGFQLRRGPAFAAIICKHKPINRAVAADTNPAAKERVARPLSRHAAGGELGVDLLARRLAEVIGVRLELVVDAQFSRRKFQFGQTFAPFSAVEIENCDRFTARDAKLPGEQKGGEMISGRYLPFARAN